MARWDYTKAWYYLGNPQSQYQGDALVAFAQHDPYAAYRTVDEKLIETVSVTDFGATGNGATDDTDAIQRAIDFFSNGYGVVYFPPGTYAISSTINMSFLSSGKKTSVNLRGGKGAIIFATSSFTTGTAMFEVIGSSGDVAEDRITGFIFDGNTDLIGVNIRGLGGVLTEYCYFKNLSIGVQYANDSGANATEGCVAYRCRFANTVGTALRYYRTSATLGSDSFHGSGLQECSIAAGNSGAGPVVKVQDDNSGTKNALIYNAPLDCTIWGSSSTVVVNTNSTMTLRTYGVIRLEGSNISLCSLSGGGVGVNHYGAVMSLNTDPTFTNFNLTGFQESSGRGHIRLPATSYNNNLLILGSNYFWVDATGDLRVAHSAPASDLSGTVVGAQT